MNWEREHQEKQHQPPKQETCERNDWISKYLELADKILEIHMPNSPRLSNES